MSGEAQSLFELIRQEGLIVVAIVALAWQVYWLTATGSQTDEKWREELTAYREAADLRTQQRLEAVRDLTTVIQKMDDRLETIQKVVLDMEEECQIWTVRKQLKAEEKQAN